MPGGHRSARHVCVTADSLLNLRIRVVPGSGVVALQGEVLLVVPSIEPAQEPALQALLAAASAPSLGRGVARVVADFDEELVPAFCLVAPGEAEGLFALVHGEIELSADGPQGGARLRGREARTWVDRLLPRGLQRLAVATADGVGPEADPYGDLRAGIVRGSGVVVTERDAELAPAGLSGAGRSTQRDTPVSDTPIIGDRAGGARGSAPATPAADPVVPSGPGRGGDGGDAAAWSSAPPAPVPSGAADLEARSRSGFRAEPIRFGQGGRTEVSGGRPLNGHDGLGHGRRAAAPATAPLGAPSATASATATAEDVPDVRPASAVASDGAADVAPDVDVIDLTAAEAADAQARATRTPEPAVAEPVAVVEPLTVAEPVTVAEPEAAPVVEDTVAVPPVDEETPVADTFAEEDEETDTTALATGARERFDAHEHFALADDEPGDEPDDASPAEVGTLTAVWGTSRASAAHAEAQDAALVAAETEAEAQPGIEAEAQPGIEADHPAGSPGHLGLGVEEDRPAGDEPPAAEAPRAGGLPTRRPGLVGRARDAQPPATSFDETPFYARTQIVPPPSAAGLVPPPVSVDPFGSAAPAAPPDFVAEPPRPQPERGRLVIENAPDVVVDRDCVIDRNPEVDPDVAQGRARGVTLPDAEQRISRVHARLLLTDDGVDIVDAGSVNGTWIEPPGAVGWIAMAPRVPAPLPLGSRIQVGDLVLSYEPRTA